MANDLVVYGFDTSNNIKVRVALGFKGLGYEFRVVDPGERAELFEVSGQYLTPVLLHDGKAICDSAAIMRYLEANFRETPRLFGNSHAQQGRSRIGSCTAGRLWRTR